jgi:tRNA 2-selenouridine synthase
VIDLEGMARHKGSAFGALGELPQPSTEQFENELAGKMAALDRARLTWIEDESRNVGKCVIPGELYQQMKDGRLLFLDIEREPRARHLVGHYAAFQKEELKQCIKKISRKLGGNRTREAVEAVEKEDYFSTAMITLHYYDKTYMFSLDKNHESYELVPSPSVDPEENAARLISYIHEKQD